MKHYLPAFVAIAHLTAGCASVPPLAPVIGPSVEIEVSTSVLKGRSIFYPDEKVRLVIFRKFDNMRLGGEELTIESPRKIVRLPADVELQFRMFKNMALMGAAVMCIGESTVKFDASKKYRANFDFDYNYDNPSASTCNGALEEFDHDGKSISKTPLSVTAMRNEVPLFIPIPIMR